MNNTFLRILSLFCSLLIALWVICDGTLAYAAVEIKDMRLAQLSPDTIRFVADLGTKADAVVFRLENPARLVVDFPQTVFSNTARGKKLPATGFIKGVRTGVPDPEKARIVFDLPKNPLIEKHFLLKPTGTTGWRFVLDLTDTATNSVLPTAATSSSVGLQPFGKNTSAVKKPIIVLDPGHGGQDPGAISRSGYYEKNITLNMARETRDILKDKGYQVVLTRDTDIFIPLRGRIQKAHEAHADLFISIHADSAKNTSAKGLSVYSISEKASDAEAAALAERENKADIIFDMDLTQYQPEVSNTLLDLAKKATMDEGSRYADLVVREMEKKVQLVPNAHRKAGFVVLKSPNIPSVLVELGYLSNKSEERSLQQKSYRKKLADSLAKAVDTYFKTHPGD